MTCLNKITVLMFDGNKCSQILFSVELQPLLHIDIKANKESPFLLFVCGGRSVCSWIHYVAQVSLQLPITFCLSSTILGLHTCTTMPNLKALSDSTKQINKCRRNDVIRTSSSGNHDINSWFRYELYWILKWVDENLRNIQIPLKSYKEKPLYL